MLTRAVAYGRMGRRLAGSVGWPQRPAISRRAGAGRASFDVFDTLLTRLVLPDEAVWREVGRRAAKDSLLTCDPDDFSAIREQAARRVRHRGTPPLLEEIEHELTALLGLEPPRARQLMLLELEVEAEMLRAVPGGRRRTDDARERTKAPLIFISDMHLPGEFIRGQLQRFGIWEPGDRLWVSCEAGARKSDGTLFPLVAAHEAVDAYAIVHTGDAELGDALAARWTGLQATPLNEARPNRYERLLARGSVSADSVAGWLAGAARQARLELAESAREHSRASQALQRVAVDVAGPVLVSYCLWLLQQAESQGKKQLFFLSRDGQILHEITAKLADHLGVHVACNYLHGGRLAWQLPALAGESGGDSLEALVSKAVDGYTQVTLAGIGTRLGIPPAHLGSQAGCGTLEESAPLLPDDRSRVRTWLQSDRGRHAVLDAAREALPRSVAYLRQQGLLDDDSWALVDVGWRGSTVRALNQLLATEGRGPAAVLFIGYVGPGADDRLPNCRSFIWDTDAEASRDRASGAMGLIEAFCSGLHGPVTGYRIMMDGTIEPTLASPKGVADAAWHLREFRVALLAFVDQLMPQLRAAHIWHTDPDTAVAVLNDFCRRPQSDEALAIGACPREEDAQGTSVFPVARPFVLADLRYLARPGPMFGRNLGWAQGALACTPSPRRQLFRTVLRLSTILRARR